MILSHQVPEYFQNKDLQLILFGGKGGVGKTTLAAATALYMAKKYPQRRILVFSTDPAHSLADSFGVEIGDKLTPIEYKQNEKSEICNPKSEMEYSAIPPGRRPLGAGGRNPQSAFRNLYARELDAIRLGDEFKQKNEAAIKRLAERGTYFDRQDVDEFFSLPLPGLDEVMAIIEIANILREEEYDLIIMDTAPTGHTIRLLSLPDQMQKWVKVLDMMQEKHRYLSRHFTGKYVKDDADTFLEAMTKDIERVKALLTNDQATEFIPVTIPEGMVIHETERLLNTLRDHHIPVKNIVINRVAGEEDCVFCQSRMKDQIDYLREIDERFGDYNLMKVPLFPHEICGIEDLMKVARALKRGTTSNNQRQSVLKQSAFKVIWGDLRRTIGVSRRPKQSAHMSVRRDRRKIAFEEISSDPRFLIFGGKGGVGKTTMAAATALYMAKKYPKKRILIFSTDPAHSLADSFNLSIGDKITPIEYKQYESIAECGLRIADCLLSSFNSEFRNPKSEIGSASTNLFALEINADELFEGFKEEYKKDIEGVFDSFLGRGVDIKFDREVIRELISLSPPGMDELMALKKIIDLKEKGEFDLFILDTSPTGHLIRFLELPEIARGWLNAVFRLLIKYKGVAGFNTIAQMTLELSRNVRKVREVLMDSQRCEFVGVTIPESMSLMETVRLLSDLKRLQVPCNNIIINMVIPRISCGFCTSKRNEQERYIREIGKSFSEYTISPMPLFPKEISGMASLREISGILYGSKTVKHGSSIA